MLSRIVDGGATSGTDTSKQVAKHTVANEQQDSSSSAIESRYQAWLAEQRQLQNDGATISGHDDSVSDLVGMVAPALGLGSVDAELNVSGCSTDLQTTLSPYFSPTNLVRNPYNKGVAYEATTRSPKGRMDVHAPPKLRDRQARRRPLRERVALSTNEEVRALKGSSPQRAVPTAAGPEQELLQLDTEWSSAKQRPATSASQVSDGESGVIADPPSEGAGASEGVTDVFPASGRTPPPPPSAFWRLNAHKLMAKMNVEPVLRTPRSSSGSPRASSRRTPRSSTGVSSQPLGPPEGRRKRQPFTTPGMPRLRKQPSKFAPWATQGEQEHQSE